MSNAIRRHLVLLGWMLLGSTAMASEPRTIALWLFDDPDYPAVTLTDAGERQIDLRLREQGRLVSGRFGRALESGAALGLVTEMACPTGELYACDKDDRLRAAPPPEALNLGYRDWTIELWFQPRGSQSVPGVLLALSNQATDLITSYANSIWMGPDRNYFILSSPEQTALAVDGAVNAEGGIVPAGLLKSAGFQLRVPTDAVQLNLDGAWTHVAFSYVARDRQLRHFINGKLQPLPQRGGFLPLKGHLRQFTLARDGAGEQPLCGCLDELRMSSGCRYRDDFVPPGTFAARVEPRRLGSPVWNPLFPVEVSDKPLNLGGRRHVFLDDALIDKRQDVTFRVHQPERVITNLRVDREWEPGARFGPGVPDVQSVFRVDGKFAMIYTSGTMWSGKPQATCLALSEDGVCWTKPDVGLIPWNGRTDNNIVMMDDAQGSVLENPHPDAPEQRFLYVAWQMQRGVYVYTSPDLRRWRRNETLALPFDTGGGVESYWDDQRMSFVTFLRHEGAWTDVGRGPGRACACAESTDLFVTWPFERLSRPGVRRGIFSLPSLTDELPIAFAPNELGQVYRSRAAKYPAAPDTYVAFPWRYDTAANRRPGCELMVSRDGVTWRGYGTQYYLNSDFQIADRQVIEALVDHGLSLHDDRVVHFATARFTAHGGAAYGGTEYDSGIHDAFLKLSLRRDGFVSLSATEAEGTVLTKPILLAGTELILNVDASQGECRVCVLDDKGNEISGLSFAECRPIRTNGNDHVVVWERDDTLRKLQGKPIRLKFYLRQADLYAMQFNCTVRPPDVDPTP